MLIRNGRSLFQNPGNFQGLVSGDLGNKIKGGLRNRDGAFNPIFSAIPNGSLFSVLPGKPGSLSSYSLEQASESTFTLVPAKPIAMTPSQGSSATFEVTKIIRMTMSPSQSSEATFTIGSAVFGSIAASQSSSALMGLGGVFPMTMSPAQGSSATARMTAIANMEQISGGADPLSPEGIVSAVTAELNPQLDEIKRNTNLIPALL